MGNDLAVGASQGEEQATQILAISVCKGASNMEGKGGAYEDTRAKDGQADDDTEATQKVQGGRQGGAHDQRGQEAREHQTVQGGRLGSGDKTEGAPTTSEAKKPENTKEAKGPIQASSGARPIQSCVLARLVGGPSPAPG